MDVPSVHNIVFIKPVNSKVYFKQHIGRGCRVDTVTEKYFFRIIDYVNAVRLLDDWDYPAGGEIKTVEGPLDLSLSGLLLNHESQEPMADGRLVAQVAPNMQRIARSSEDGRFTLTQLPRSPIKVSITKTGFRSRQLTVTPSEEMHPIVVELKPEKPAVKKILLTGLEVHIAEEVRIILTADGRTLTEAEYVEYSREGVVKRAATLEHLYGIWTDREERKSFLGGLRNVSIYPGLLASIVKVPDADAFDIIAHVAFNTPVLTRDERANAFINKKSAFLSALGGKAQEVVLSLHYQPTYWRELGIPM